MLLAYAVAVLAFEPLQSPVLQHVQRSSPTLSLRRRVSHMMPENDEPRGRVSGGRLGGRLPDLDEPVPQREPTPAKSGAGIGGPVASLIALFLASKLLLGIGGGEEYYVYTSSSSSVTIIDENGQPRTQSEQSSSFRTNIPGLTSPDRLRGQ